MARQQKQMIEVTGLVKHYVTGKIVTKALRGISFQVHEGEFFGIMGPSGCGKSTTLHQLGLLDYPTEGKIVIDGMDVSALSDYKRSYFRLNKLGYVFQQYRNIPELTALENVELPARMAGLPPERCRKQAKALLEEVGLGDRLHHRPFELSGGEQQRVAVARALINRPAIMFADEPTANLDSAAGDVILNLLKKFNREHGQTIIMVSHEPEHTKYFDRVLWMRDGRLERIEERRKS